MIGYPLRQALDNEIIFNTNKAILNSLQWLLRSARTGAGSRRVGFVVSDSASEDRRECFRFETRGDPGSE